MADIRQAFNIDMPISTLLEHSTLRSLLEQITSGNKSERDGFLRSVRSGGDKTPFFFLHQDSNYDGLYCAELAQHLDAKRPIYVLAPKSPGNTKIPECVEDMADLFLESILAVKPKGPYILGGFCAGGTVAFEIAQRLRAQGEHVELVVLLNSVAKNERWVTGQRMVGLACRLLRKSTDDERAAFLRMRSLFSNPDRTLRRVATKVLKKFAPRIPAESSEQSNHHPADGDQSDTSWLVYSRATNAYMPAPYPGNVVVYMAEAATAPRLLQAALGWKRFATRVTSESFSGVQNDLITKHIASIGLSIERTLKNTSQPKQRRA